MSARGKLVLDGVGDEVSMAGTISGVKSVLFWTYPDDISGLQFLVRLSAAAGIILNGATLFLGGWPAVTATYVDGEVGNTIAAGSWQFLAVTTTDGTGITADVIFVSLAAISLAGKISDMMIFDGLLSQANIQEIYNLGRNPTPSQIANVAAYGDLHSWLPFTIDAEDIIGDHEGSFVDNAYVDIEANVPVANHHYQFAGAL